MYLANDIKYLNLLSSHTRGRAPEKMRILSIRVYIRFKISSKFSAYFVFFFFLSLPSPYRVSQIKIGRRIVAEQNRFRIHEINGHSIFTRRSYKSFRWLNPNGPKERLSVLEGSKGRKGESKGTNPLLSRGWSLRSRLLESQYRGSDGDSRLIQVGKITK